MENRFERTQLLLGEEAMKILKKSRVAVFGIGGVGGYTVEALARSGIGEIDIIDSDTVSLSNINRQIIATSQTIGMAKVDAFESRIKAISPDIAVNRHNCFYLPENADRFDFTQYDYVVDAVDTVKAKLQLVLQAKAADVPIISSMGAGNKLDATAFSVDDIYNTSVCPLARVMRRELKKLGVKRLKVVYSKEPPAKPVYDEGKRIKTVGSAAFVTGVAGMILSGEVIKDLITK